MAAIPKAARRTSRCARPIGAPECNPRTIAAGCPTNPVRLQPRRNLSRIRADPTYEPTLPTRCCPTLAWTCTGEFGQSAHHRAPAHVRACALVRPATDPPFGAGSGVPAGAHDL